MAKGYNHLTEQDRIFLSQMLRQGYTKAKIAKILGVHRATVYREINRNIFIPSSPENETRKIGEGLAKLIKKPILEESPIEKFFPIGSPEFNVELKKIVEQIQNNKTLAMPDHVYKV